MTIQQDPVPRQIQAEFFLLAEQPVSDPLQEQTPQSVETDFTDNPTSLIAEDFFNRGCAKHGLNDKQGTMADYQFAAQLYQQQGDMESYRNTLKAILQFEKKGKGFLGGLFS